MNEKQQIRAAAIAACKPEYLKAQANDASDIVTVKLVYETEALQLAWIENYIATGSMVLELDKETSE